jgi:hypothetical protein
MNLFDKRPKRVNSQNASDDHKSKTYSDKREAGRVVLRYKIQVRLLAVGRQ